MYSTNVDHVWRPRIVQLSLNISSFSPKSSLEINTYRNQSKEEVSSDSFIFIYLHEYLCMPDALRLEEGIRYPGVTDT